MFENYVVLLIVML